MKSEIPVYVGADREAQIGTLVFEGATRLIGEIVRLLLDGVPLQLHGAVHLRTGTLTEFSIYAFPLQAIVGVGRISGVGRCARCGKDHRGLWFEQMDNPVVDSDGTPWTHWAPCPTNGQPILWREG